MSRPVRKTSSNLNIDQDFPEVGELKASIWSILNEKIDRSSPPNFVLVFARELQVSSECLKAFLSSLKPAHEAQNAAALEDFGVHLSNRKTGSASRSASIQLTPSCDF